MTVQKSKKPNWKRQSGLKAQSALDGCFQGISLFAELPHDRERRFSVTTAEHVPENISMKKLTKKKK